MHAPHDVPVEKKEDVQRHATDIVTQNGRRRRTVGVSPIPTHPTQTSPTSAQTLKVTDVPAESQDPVLLAPLV